MVEAPTEDSCQAFVKAIAEVVKDEMGLTEE
jgi:hypothetical protein